ncbi:MAG TPA: Rieske 2Fe-2S domain-containing protein [Chloroflexota bacterium]|nr:Rieske 2Fe-2S domain-containing protein [Chloroflexota bacterium]
MLSHEENELLTRTGADTPMGRLARRYWLPALLSEELPEPDGAPVRVKLMGERLVAFRRTDGQVGLVGEFCPHRGASLVLARNEENGLRCIYHGWQIGCDGAVLDTPTEKAASNFKDKLRQTAYPTREAGGMVWTYMGPAEHEPPFPAFPWNTVPDSHVYSVKILQESNYFQGIEGGLDPIHVQFLHRQFDGPVLQQRNAALGGAIDMPPDQFTLDTDYGFRSAAIRGHADANRRYVRVTPFMMPWWTIVPYPVPEVAIGRGTHAHAWVPIDDEHCWVYYIHFDPYAPVDRSLIDGRFGWSSMLAPGYVKKANASNLYMQDRDVMRTVNYSGIGNAVLQDLAINETQGPIYDRSVEHLGTSDVAVITLRRRMLQAVRHFEESGETMGQQTDYAQVRGVALAMSAEIPWEDADAEFDRQVEARLVPA